MPPQSRLLAAFVVSGNILKSPLFFCHGFPQKSPFVLRRFDIY